jgi:hypothetical protein
VGVKNYKGTVECKKMELAGFGGVQALLEGFDFKANFVVISYDFTAVIKGQAIPYTGNSPGFTGDMKTALGKASTGSKIFIDNVKAKGPDGTVRSIPGLTIKVKG